jgi:ferredoxin
MTLRANSQGGGGETENTQYESEHCEDRRGDVTEAAPNCPFASIDIISFITMIKKK